MLPDFLFHHIGIAVNNIENTGRYYVEAGYTLTDTIYEPVQNVSIAFLEKDGMPRIELIEPADNGTEIRKILSRSGVSPYHLCYEVNDIEDAVNKLRKKKFMPLARPVAAVTMDNRKICFLYNKEVGLIELVENKL
jgi:methylmalonyl-CoA/ethylmalonyl-CoA epimerase